MSENQTIEKGKIPEYLKLNEKGRYICSMCGNSVSKLFADLGCECDGKGYTKNYKEIESELEDLVSKMQDSGLSEDEIRNLKCMFDEGFLK